ncbi:HAMP domain-containing protein [Brumimicrobium glaciale]|uniref:histidine kinase n=1 Tax=Brumimicrobium glaciale TaxID=200475 RepID=A0A4Q4KPG2_9FLAO|nr:ATP-binding protein [Brumimicrobium glaciale]RYM35418.1 HAMP domain-containing protein [Brumimicrobium glaciale]
MISISNKTKWLVLALISILLSWAAYSIFYNTDIESEQERFQNDFSQLEKRQNQFKKSIRKVVKSNTIAHLWTLQDLQKSDFSIHILRNDSLVYWNSNEINIDSDFSKVSNHFVGKFSNGYYLVDQFQVHDLQVFITSKIKNEFFYENNALKNNLSSAFSTTNEVSIQWEKNGNNNPVISDNGKTLFYFTVHQEKSIGTTKQLLIFCLYAFGFLSLFIALTKIIIGYAHRHKWLILAYPVFLIFLRYLSIHFGWIKLFSEFELYDPILYANNSLIPNLGSLVLTLIIISILVWWVLYFLHVLRENTRKGAFVLAFSYLSLLVFSAFISYIFESLIINSSISMKIDEVFSLNLYSVIALIVISALFLAYYLLVRQISIKLVRSSIPLNRLAILWFISGVVFVFIEIIYIQKNIFNALWPVLLNALFFYLATKNTRINALKYHIAIVIVIGFYGAVILFENNESNEHQKRELFANQLITDQDPNMELEYATTVDKLIQDPNFYHLVDEKDLFTAPNLSNQIENCCFGEFWERYELSFFFFQQDGTPLMDYISNQSKTKEEIDHLIDIHSAASSIAEELYFVKDYYDQLSYIGRREIIRSDSSKLDFYILFKSKKIPEQIGFPRLLMNEKSYALQDLEDYSIARYSNDKLVMRFGSYNFPTSMTYFQKQFSKKAGFITIEGMSHLIYQQDDGQAVVISKPEKRFIEQLSTFSYLVLFFGIFALITLLIFNWKTIFPLKTLQLSLKVQVVLIGMVVGSFIIFAYVAIQNVTRQYGVYTNDNLKEKIYSVEIEIDQKIGDKEKLVPSIHGDYLNYILKKFANVFVTDINFYALDGELFATSQPKLYDKGVSTMQMNNRAFYAMNFNQRSEFIHLEEIGELSFLSAYLPYTNHEGKLLGYINLQHFSKQNAFENQMNDFIVAVINIAVLLLVITVVVAIFVSGWITAPLRLIQQSFRKMELGKENKPIDYKGDDEIGALVKDYNNKLIELELKAMQLAKSERETAWREMAKQVAHEIKNPLTPMKLSVQHFQRSFDVNDPNAKEKMQRIANSLIEQIDALTKIANEFSNFAKMPKANEESLNLIPILYNIVDLYSSNKVLIDLVVDKDKDWTIFADKNLIIRVFNNLVKNAIQATPEKSLTNITISCVAEEEHFLISVHDEGLGIPEDIQKKMFSPNFTTKTTGSGLGLAMVKQIINNHNGEIWFESEKGSGTTFYIRLPKVND